MNDIEMWVVSKAIITWIYYCESVGKMCVVLKDVCVGRRGWIENFEAGILKTGRIGRW